MNPDTLHDINAVIQKNGHLIINVQKETSLEEQFKKAIKGRDYKLAVKIQADIRAENNRKAPVRQYR